MSGELKSFVESFYGALERSDWEGLKAKMADDVEWHIPGAEAVLPWAGTRRTPEEAVQAIRSFYATLKIESFEPSALISDGDRVLYMGKVVAHVKETGARIEDEMVDQFQVKDGKIVAFREYLDTAKFEDAFRKR